MRFSQLQILGVLGLRFSGEIGTCCLCYLFKYCFPWRQQNSFGRNCWDTGFLTSITKCCFIWI